MSGHGGDKRVGSMGTEEEEHQSMKLNKQMSSNRVKRFIFVKFPVVFQKWLHTQALENRQRRRVG